MLTTERASKLSACNLTLYFMPPPMPFDRKADQPSRARSNVAEILLAPGKWGGILAVPLGIALLSAVDRFFFPVPNQPAVLLCFVVAAGFWGGLQVSLFAAALHVAYAAWFFSGTNIGALQLYFDWSLTSSLHLRYTEESFRRVVVFLVTAPVVGIAVGYLRNLLAAEAARLRSTLLALQRFKATLDSTQDCVFMFAPDTLQFFYVNQGACAQLGYTEAELLKLHPYDINSAYPEPKFREMIAPLLDGSQASVRFETLHQHKDGHDVAVEVYLQYIALDGEQPRFVNIVTDITERKLVNESLRESQKMEALGQLTGGLAHDFNNLLGVVIGNLDEIEEQLPEGNEKLRQRHRTALAAALGGAELTYSLLAVARRQPLKVETLELNTLVKEMLPLMRSAAGAALVLRTEICNEDLMAPVDAAGLSSALLNLAVNARDAMKDMSGEHRLVLRTRRASGDGTTLKAGEYALLEVEDNGPGMSQTVKERAFDPFFTTKEMGRGTGLGLSMVRGFCEQLGGTARIGSAPASGTKVSLCLPLAASAAA